MCASSPGGHEHRGTTYAAAVRRGARFGVAGVAGGAVALLLAVATRYGWHRDELYFLEAGKHLQWGYVDQPPFTPLVARLAHEVAPGNLVVLRLAPALATALTIVLGALIARDLGGDRRAQVAAAAAVAGGGFALGAGHLLATSTFDLTAWLALLWVGVRLLGSGDPRWWRAFGAVGGVALLNKSLVVLLAGAFVAGLVAERRWELLRTRLIVAGAAMAVVIASPQLVWQARNGWPQFDMARVLAERLAVENRVTLIPGQVLLVGPLLAYLLWRGARWLARVPAARPFRALLWAWPIATVVTFATAGRPYYALPFTMVVLVAGIVATTAPRRRRRLTALVIANAVLTIPVSLPVLPVTTLAHSNLEAVNEALVETVGWPEMVDQVAAVVHELPARERATVVLLGYSYGEAGALDRFGSSRGLPPAYSSHNHYWFFRQPTDDDATVVAVRWTPRALERWFDECEIVATVDNGVDVPNEVQGQPIVVCRGLRGTWHDVWPEMKFLG